MNLTIRGIAYIGAAVVAAAAGSAQAQSSPKAAAHWEGRIQIPNRELPIAVDLAPNAAGAWIGSMTVVGSSSVDVPLTDIVVNDSTVRFAAMLPKKATFTGRVAAGAAGVSGTVSSLDGEAPFELARSGAANVKVPPPSSALPKELEGTWEGAAVAGERTLAIAFRLSRGADGLATAVMTAVAQGVDYPATTVTVAGNALHIDLRSISGTYNGTLGADGTITGEWAQGQNHLPLTLTRRAP